MNSEAAFRRVMTQPIGILNVNKPTGVTSRDVVNLIQRAVKDQLQLQEPVLPPRQGKVKPAKVGHAGTLDPLASGVLAVCVGPATRLIQYIQQMQKTYIACFLLGQVSDTDDLEGEVRPTTGAVLPDRDQLRAQLRRFVGQIEQAPPAYSAVKIQGRRAYRLARSGRNVSPAARTVRVDAIQLLNYSPPEVQVRIRCGSGVYIRSIGRDLGAALGCGALMSSLQRTAIGCFEIQQAAPLERLADSWQSRLLPPRLAVCELPSVTIDEEDGRRLAQGLPVSAPQVAPDQQYAVLRDSGQLAAVAVGDSTGRLRPVVNMSVPSPAAEPSPRRR